MRIRDLRAELASFTESARGLARLGVVFCAALTLGTGLWRLVDDALPGQDYWATLNSRQTYAERTFPSDEYIGSGRVAEDGRLWMGRNARYRVVVGEDHRYTPWGWAAPNFLAGFLFPRRPEETGPAAWVFCLGCDDEERPPGFEVLSDGANGVVFGKVRP